MGRRQLNEDVSWEQARKELRYNASAVAAEPAHIDLAPSLRSLLTEWDVLEQARRSAEDGVVDANVGVSRASTRTNEWIKRLAGQLRAELPNDEHPTFRKFFATKPSELTRQSLENKLERLHKFHTVADEVTVSAAVQAILAGLSAVEADGRQALDARAAAYDEVTRVTLRMAGWKERADLSRRTLEGTLGRYAADQKLASDYTEQFFLPAPKPSAARQRPPKTPPKTTPETTPSKTPPTPPTHAVSPAPPAPPAPAQASQTPQAAEAPQAPQAKA
ncbi:MAG TPA: hypothetical protein VH877_01780 [Polyangia bacterium]|jgi:hypothetical protein|nr:hypothetical protein [Polyangia bacterium]